MNSFERHGITRLSPSSLNHFVAEPAHFVMQRLLNLRAPASAAAARGSAVERAVHLGLINPSLPAQTCIADAEIAFDREMALNADDRRDSERGHIPGYVTNALSELRPYGIRRRLSIGSRSGSTMSRSPSRGISTGASTTTDLSST